MSDGWNQSTRQTNHAQAMRFARQLTFEAATYTRRDCIEAAAANPQGEKAGHYIDIAHYCGMRLVGSL